MLAFDDQNGTVELVTALDAFEYYFRRRERMGSVLEVGEIHYYVVGHQQGLASLFDDVTVTHGILINAEVSAVYNGGNDFRSWRDYV